MDKTKEKKLIISVILTICTILVIGIFTLNRFFLSGHKTIRETTLSIVPEGHTLIMPSGITYTNCVFDSRGFPRFSNDGTTVVYKVKKDGKYFMVNNNSLSEPYDVIEEFILSPDGQKMAYVVQKEGKECVVLNKEDDICYDDNNIYNLIFSPDSQRFGYIVNGQNFGYVVVDGKKGEMFDMVSSLFFSSNSQETVYIGWRNGEIAGSIGEQFIMLNNTPYASTTGVINGITFSNDSQRIVYFLLEREENRWGKRFLVSDGQKKEINYFSCGMKFSPDDKKIAFVGRKEPHSVLVINGEEEKSYEEINDLVFSPDSKTLIFFTRRYGKMLLVKNREEIEISGIDVLDIKFSPNSKNFAYIAYSKLDSKYPGGVNPKMFLGINGKEDKNGYDYISNLQFSSDSGLLSYGVLSNNKFSWRVDSISIK